MSQMHAIELGVKARDRVSGWTGYVTGRYEYLNGCERYELSGADKDGKPEGFVFDAQQIEVLSGVDLSLRGMPGPLPAKAQQPDPGPGTSYEWNARKPRAAGRGGPRDNAPVPR